MHAQHAQRDVMRTTGVPSPIAVQGHEGRTASPDQPLACTAPAAGRAGPAWPTNRPGPCGVVHITVWCTQRTACEGVVMPSTWMTTPANRLLRGCTPICWNCSCSLELLCAMYLAKEPPWCCDSSPALLPCCGQREARSAGPESTGTPRPAHPQAPRPGIGPEPHRLDLPLPPQVRAHTPGSWTQAARAKALAPPFHIALELGRQAAPPGLPRRRPPLQLALSGNDTPRPPLPRSISGAVGTAGGLSTHDTKPRVSGHTGIVDTCETRLVGRWQAIFFAATC